jgi:putative phosphoesterase
MRIAALYDIHGNLTALDSVLDEVRREGVEQIVVGGDVLPGPLARECLDRLLALDVPVAFICGNGDRDVLAWIRNEPSNVPAKHRRATGWIAERLPAEHVRFIENWPATYRVPPSGQCRILFCHATPRNDTEIFTRLTVEAKLRPVFQDADAPLVVCGHTHMQFDRMVGDVRVVNAGSVGMPFGEPVACWLLLAPQVELRQTPYDLPMATEAICATTYPDSAEFVEQYILHPPSEEQMLEVFARAELA